MTIPNRPHSHENRRVAMWKVLIISAAGFLVISAASRADVVYRWRDASGVLHYTDTPPGAGARDVKMLQTPGQTVNRSSNTAVGGTSTPGGSAASIWPSASPTSAGTAPASGGTLSGGTTGGGTSAGGGTSGGGGTSAGGGGGTASRPAATATVTTPPATAPSPWGTPAPAPVVPPVTVSPPAPAPTPVVPPVPVSPPAPAPAPVVPPVTVSPPAPAPTPITFTIDPPATVSPPAPVPTPVVPPVTVAPPAPAPTPAPVVPPVTAGSARLLFSSGFEGMPPLNAPSGFFGNGAWQSIDGVDGATGFAWPPNIWSGGPTHFQMIAFASVDGGNLGNYQVNRIETVTGHKGTPTRALYSEIKQSGCCGTNPMGNEVDQDALMMQPTGESSDLYISYWIKYQPNLLQLMNLPNSNWRLLF